MNPEVRISPNERIGGSPPHTKSRTLPYRYLQHTPVRWLTHQIATAAIAGFGFALGRDIYRTTKAGLRLALIAAVPLLWALLPWLAGYFAFRRRGYLDVGAGVVAACFGYLACLTLCVMLAGLWSMSATTSMPAETGIIFFAAALVFAPSFFLGARVGAHAGERDEAVATVADHNQAFLGRHGIRETGGRDITHYDGAGNPLRFIETHHDQMLFMVVGRRGRRVSISLDLDGRMVAYSGV